MWAGFIWLTIWPSGRLELKNVQGLEAWGVSWTVQRTIKFQTVILLREVVWILSASVVSPSFRLRSGSENPIPTLVGMCANVIIVSVVWFACRKKTKALKEKAQKDAEKRNKNYEKMKQKAEKLAEKEQNRLRKEREKMKNNPDDVSVMPHRYILYVQNDLFLFYSFSLSVSHLQLSVSFGLPMIHFHSSYFTLLFPVTNFHNF